MIMWNELHERKLESWRYCTCGVIAPIYVPCVKQKRKIKYFFLEQNIIELLCHISVSEPARHFAISSCYQLNRF